MLAVTCSLLLSLSEESFESFLSLMFFKGWGRLCFHHQPPFCSILITFPFEGCEGANEAISVPSREAALHKWPCNINPICGGGLASRPAPSCGISTLPLPAYLPFLNTPYKKNKKLFNSKVTSDFYFNNFFFLFWRFCVVLLINETAVLLTIHHQ